jgi:hypothetical protein
MMKKPVVWLLWYLPEIGETELLGAYRNKPLANAAFKKLKKKVQRDAEILDEPLRNTSDIGQWYSSLLAKKTVGCSK